MTITAPTGPIPIQVELYGAGDWRSIPSDVLERSDMSIGYGLPNEAGSVQPSTMSMLLDNRSGNYDPTNPVGPYWGSIGRNTPMRVSILSDTDQFNRTVANGWGTSDSGDAWGAIGFGGPTASAFAVSSGIATHSIAATTAFALSTTTMTWGDVDVAATWSVLNATAVAGGQIEPCNIVVRGQDSNNYYMARFVIGTNQHITVALMDKNTVTFAAPVDTGLLHSTLSAQSFRVRVQVEGQTVRAKIWQVSSPAAPEPAGWVIVGSYSNNFGTVEVLDTPGFVGIRSGVGSGNTNTQPIVFSYSNFVVRAPRWSGNVFLQPTTDISGQDKTVAVTGGSVLRQLAQGTLPVASPLRHDIPSLPHLLAYWPCEDGQQAVSFASALPNGQPMLIGAGTPSLAADSTFVGSAPLPISNGSYWLGYTGSTDTSGLVQVRCLMKFPPAATLVDQTVLFRVHTRGTVIRWDLVYNAGGALSLQVFDTNGTNVFTSGAIGFGVDGDAMRIGLSIEPAGSNITAQLQVYQQGSPVSAGSPLLTITGQSITTCYALAIAPPGNNIAQSVVGQITVENAFTDMNDLLAQVNAFTGEGVSTRLTRLCGYANIEVDLVGRPTAAGLAMGPQQIDNLYNLIQACATSDGGILYEAKGSTALVYRTGGGHSQGPLDPIAVALSRTLHHLSSAPVATYDDSNLKNDVTVNQPDGSSIEVVQTTGPMSTAIPPAGVGTYATTVQANLSTANEVSDLASWVLHLGTVATARYPTISVNLLRTGNASLYWRLLDVAPDTMITLAGQAPDLITLLARGYTETLNSFNHQIAWNCAPGEPYFAAVLDDGVSRLDTAASGLPGGGTLSTTATSFSIVSSDGTNWTTSAGDLPLDILMDGERMTVTAISGTGTTQTFTAVRSVNGVVKTHISNLGQGAITLATPLYLALGR